ncbi:MAG: WecB/TagA/CpsF family glycosyltransferase [Victivallales bacterium]|nr:WecB/TagA/CpsF family glycosyltransferase [Victivallales bacterium]
MFTTVQVLDLKINVSSLGQAVDEVQSLIDSGEKHYVCFIEGNLLHNYFSRPKEIAEILNAASLSYPDGASTAKFASIAAGHPVERVTGPSFFIRACEEGIKRDWKHYFYGGAEGVAEQLADTMRERFPGIQIVGVKCPPFRPPTDEEINSLADELREKKVDLLWVALGGPRQEKWMHQYLGRIPVPVMFGVGAAFDFHTENQSWAPPLIRKIKMEWLWRAVTGGRRVFLRNIVCVSHVAWRLFLYRLFH